MTTKSPIRLLSEIEIDLTPSYPQFTPLSLATLGLAPPGAFPPSPLNTLALPLPLPDNDWDSSGASSCDAAGTEAAGCSCEPSNNTPAVNSINALLDYSLSQLDHSHPLSDPSLDLEEVYPSIYWRDGPPPPDHPSNPPLDPLPSGSFLPHLPVELETRSTEFDVDSLPSHSFVGLERRSTDHPLKESLDTLNDPLPDRLCHTRPVLSNQT